MRIDAAYVPSERSQWLQLTRSRQGRLFKKKLLAFGEWEHPNLPGQKLVIDRPLAQRLVENFHRGVVDTVQVPVADDSNKHTEDPLRNLGEVVDLTVEEDGVWAVLDIRKPEAADQLGKTLLGISGMIHLDYQDTKTGKKVGPALLHTLITNRPYLSDLGDFRELVAAAAPGMSVVPLRASDFSDEETGWSYCVEFADGDVLDVPDEEIGQQLVTWAYVLDRARSIRDWKKTGRRSPIWDGPFYEAEELVSLSDVQGEERVEMTDEEKQVKDNRLTEVERLVALAHPDVPQELKERAQHLSRSEDERKLDHEVARLRGRLEREFRGGRRG